MRPSRSTVLALLAGIAGAAVAAQGVALAVPARAALHAVFIAWLLAGISAAGAMSAVWWTNRRGPARRGSALFTVGAACWLAGAALRYEAALGGPAFLVHAADGLWLAAPLATALGITIRSPRGLLSYRLFLLDTMPAVLLAAAVAATGAGTSSSAPDAALAGGFALWVVPALIVLQMMALDGLRRATSAWWLLAGGWTLQAAAAIGWPAAAERLGPDGPPHWASLLWTLGMVLTASSGIERTRDPVRGYFSNPERESSRRAALGAASTLALLALAAAERADAVLAVPALLAFAAFALRSVIARDRMGRLVEDLTRSREALQASERRFRSIFESTAIGVSVWTIDGRILEANRALEEMLGYGPGELLGRSLADLTHPEDVGDSIRLRDQLVRGERQWFQQEKRYVRRDGEILWGRVTSSLIRDAGTETTLGISALENIDARRRAEESLAEAEARYRTLVEELPFVTYIAAPDAPRPIYMSPQVEPLLGYAVEEWLADPDLYRNILHPDDRDRVLEGCAAIRRRGGSLEAEYRLRAKDGREVWVRDAASVVQGPDGRPLQVQGHLMDISEQRRAEEAIARSRRILEAVAAVSETLLSAPSWEEVAEAVVQMLGESAAVSRAYLVESRRSPDGVERSSRRAQWTAPGVEPLVGDGASDGLGLAASPAFAGALAAGRVVAGSAERFRSREREELERHGVRSVLLAPIMVDGRCWGWLGLDECTADRVWAEGEIEAVRTAAGTLAAAIERDHAEATERQAVQTLQAVVKASPAAIVGLDRDGCVVIWNPAAEAMFGWREEEVLGRPSPNVPPEGREQFADLLERAAAGESWNDVEIVRRHKDGYPVYVSSSAAPLRDADGTIVGSVAVLVDIGERKAAERERERLLAAEREARAEAEAARELLAEQNERLRELDALKDEFVALVSHELRTPLTSILGYLDLALDPAERALPDDLRELLAVAQRNARRLLHLVGDLLFLAQADAGKLAFAREPVDLAAVGRECVEAATPQALGKGIELVVDVPPVAPVVGDRMRLAQLFDNLISNAIKFTPPGGRVEVTVDQAGGDVVLTVRDTGIGVAANEQGRLFERFFRSTNAMRKAIQGTGLGLAITKTIVEGHGGRISVASEEGVGTTFRVVLPRSLALAA